MRALVLLAVGCGGATTIAPGWHPVVFHHGTGTPGTLPFADGTNGTQLVVAALQQARAANATGISDIAIQIGHCIREVSLDAPLPAPERITFETTESDYACKRANDLEIIAAPSQGFSRKEGFRDTQVVEREECTTETRTRVVSRYRVDMEHRFVPPRWDMIARWTGLRLHAGPLHCDAPDERTELRMTLHAGETLPVEAPVVAPRPDPRAILEHVEHAKHAHDPAIQTAEAERALALWSLSDFEADEPREVAIAVAAARFHAVAADADRFMSLALPPIVDAAWTAQVGAELDRIAKRYESIGDEIRMPEARPWLAAGAGTLAKLHLHVADLMDQMRQGAAAEKQRAEARRIEASAR